MKLISFVPQTAAYSIYYPEKFILNEGDDGIVSITSPETASNLTLSSYQVNQHVTDKMLLDLLNDATADFELCSDWQILETNQEHFFEGTHKKDNVNWIWWGLSKDNQIVVASINSGNALSDEDYNLFKFMIDKMEIYPSKFE